MVLSFQAISPSFLKGKDYSLKSEYFYFVKTGHYHFGMTRVYVYRILKIPAVSGSIIT